MMKILLIVLAIYLLGMIIYYMTGLQDMEEFSVVSESILNNPQADAPNAEKAKAKWVYAFVVFLGSLMWPLLLILRFRKTEKVD